MVTKRDFITHDRLDEKSSNISSNVFSYVPDRDLAPRKPEVKTVNQLGGKLVSLRKSSGLRIMNGRHAGDKEGRKCYI